MIKKSGLRILQVLLATLFILTFGCNRTPFVERAITASTPDEFAEWRARLGAEVTEAEWKDFDVAVQELKIQVMAERGGSAKQVLDEGMRAKINGKTFREALILGFQARRDRLDRERAEVQARLDHDARLMVRADDTKSSSYLNSVRRADTDRKDLLTREVAEINQKLTGWGATATAVAQKAGPASGTPVATQDTR